MNAPRDAPIGSLRAVCAWLKPQPYGLPNHRPQTNRTSLAQDVPNPPTTCEAAEIVPRRRPTQGECGLIETHRKLPKTHGTHRRYETPRLCVRARVWGIHTRRPSNGSASPHEPDFSSKLMGL